MSWRARASPLPARARASSRVTRAAASRSGRAARPAAAAATAASAWPSASAAVLGGQPGPRDLPHQGLQGLQPVHPLSGGRRRRSPVAVGGPEPPVRSGRGGGVEPRGGRVTLPQCPVQHRQQGQARGRPAVGLQGLLGPTGGLRLGVERRQPLRGAGAPLPDRPGDASLVEDGAGGGRRGGRSAMHRRRVVRRVGDVREDTGGPGVDLVGSGRRQRVRRQPRGRLDPGPVRDPVDQPLHRRLSGLGVLASPARVLVHPLLDACVTIGVEQPLEHVVAVLAARLQEPLELALRQHRHLLELRRLHAHQLGHHQPHLGGPGGQEVLLPGGELEQDGGRLLGGRPFTTALRPRPLRRASYDEAPVADAEVEDHLGTQVVGGVLRLERLDPPHAGDLAEEGEADGVEDARLAGSRRAGEQEQAGVVEGVEVDVLGAGERAERRHGELVQLHRTTPGRRGPGGLPCGAVIPRPPRV